MREQIFKRAEELSGIIGVDKKQIAILKENLEHKYIAPSLSACSASLILASKEDAPSGKSITVAIRKEPFLEALSFTACFIHRGFIQIALKS